MRLSSLFTILLISLLAGCGSNNEESTSTSSSSPIPNLPPIVQGPINDITVKDGEFYRPITFVDDATNNRWLIADRFQGIIAVDKTTDSRTVLTPIDTAADELGIKSIRDIALDPATNSLYVLDTAAARISRINTTTGEVQIVKTSDDFDELNDAGWGAPTSLFFDTTNQRLLIGDRLGLAAISETNVTYLTFCVFIYTPSADSITIMAEASNRASPVTKAEIYDIYFDASTNTLLAEGLYYITTQTRYYAGLKIPENNWENKSYFHLNLAGGVVNEAVLHAISYDPATKTAYIVNSNLNAILGFDLNSETNPINPTIVTSGNDGKAYPFKRALAMTFSSTDGLLVLDESSRALTKIADVILAEVEAGDSAARTLVTSGTRISADATVVIQSPYDILVEPSDTLPPKLVITDRYSLQVNTIGFNGEQYAVWPFTYDMSGITPYKIKYKETDENIPAPSLPKPLLVSKNSDGDMFIFASGFRLATDNPLEQDSYPFAFYQRLAGETEFKPISTTLNSKKELQVVNFEQSFKVTEVQDFTVTEKGIVVLVNKANSSNIIYWEFASNKIGVLSDTTTFYSPRWVTGLEIAPDNNSFYFIDSDHDALISVAISLEDERPKYTFKLISGRQNIGDAYLAIPWGLAVNKSGTKAWTYENSIRALVEIDLVTGTRKRIDSNPNYLQAAGRIALSEDETTLYITDKAVNRILTLNLLTGEQDWLKP